MADELIKKNTLMSDYMAVINKDKAMCSEAVVWLEDFIAKNPKATYDDLAQHITDAGFMTEAWLVWTLKKFGAKFSPEMRKRALNRISNEMIAFKLYTDLPWLTDEEDAVLLGKFKDKLPTAEDELKNGRVKRVKVK